MNLSHPLSALASLTMARVLEVLAGTTRPLTGREIHRIAGQGGVASVWRVLQRLNEQGIVIADHRGTAVYYTANREHLAWPPIEAIIRIRTRLIESLVQLIRGWEIQPVHASLFGSAARGDGDSESDIDLLVIRPDALDQVDEERWQDQLAALRAAVRLWTGNDCQTLQVDRMRLLEHVEAGDPLVASWLRDGIALTDTPLADLVGERLRELPRIPIA